VGHAAPKPGDRPAQARPRVATIPWHPLRPVATGRIALCRPSQLRFSADGWDGITGGTLAAWVRALNLTDRACLAPLAPVVEGVVDAGGEALPLKIIAGRTALARRKRLVLPHGTAVDRMIENARLVGANAIIGMRFDSSEMGETLTEIVAYGTAVVVSAG
jgi:hypothetical protein